MQLAQINSYILEDITSAEHPSDFITDSNYTALILRLPFIEDNRAKIESFAFIITHQKIYEYNRDQKSLLPIGDFRGLHKRLDTLIDRLIKDIKTLHLQIDDMEDSIYQNNDRGIMVQWSYFKQNVSLIRRMVFNADIAYELFIKHYSNKYNFDTHAFYDIQEHISRVKNLARAAEERLDNLHDFYRTRVDEKMNKNMYYLTIISGIFMPLSLITGFFGINTGGLPWTNNPNGTLYVIVLSIAVEVIFLFTFMLLLRKK